MKKLMILGVLAACGPASDGRVDAGVGSGSAPSNGAEDLTCQSYTMTTTNSDGSKTASTTKYALVDGVDPTSDYLIELCDLVQIINGAPPPACSAGTTCALSGTPPPTAAHVCGWYKGGSFSDDKLMVSCGTKYVSTSSTGVVTETVETSYSAVRIRR